MTTVLGPNFGSELVAAAAADGIAWNSQGITSPLEDLTDAQRAVIAAHDPATPNKAVHNAAILAQIAALDVYVPRGLEDAIAAYGWDVTKLPAIQQTRLAQKVALRAQLQA